MIETLLTLRRDTHMKFFQSKHDPKAAGEGWALVVKDWCVKHEKDVPLSKICSKYDALLKKWRDFGPTGKESKKTGNVKPDPNTLDDPILAVITPFFAKSPGTGSDLGQSTDYAVDSSSNEDENDIECDFDSPKPAERPFKRPRGEVASKPADIGEKMESAFALVSESVFTLAKAVSGQAPDTLVTYMQESRQAIVLLQQSIDNSSKIQLAMLEAIQKLANSGS